MYYPARRTNSTDPEGKFCLVISVPLNTTTTIGGGGGIKGVGNERFCEPQHETYSTDRPLEGAYKESEEQKSNFFSSTYYRQMDKREVGGFLSFIRKEMKQES